MGSVEMLFNRGPIPVVISMVRRRSLLCWLTMRRTISLTPFHLQPGSEFKIAVRQGVLPLTLTGASMLSMSSSGGLFESSKASRGSNEPGALSFASAQVRPISSTWCFLWSQRSIASARCWRLLDPSSFLQHEAALAKNEKGTDQVNGSACSKIC
jgi:hypothetical protein